LYLGLVAELGKVFLNLASLSGLAVFDHFHHEFTDFFSRLFKEKTFKLVFYSMDLAMSPKFHCGFTDAFSLSLLYTRSTSMEIKEITRKVVLRAFLKCLVMVFHVHL